MVKISKIVDRNSFEAWLKGQPREVAVALASRVALRVAPLLVGYFRSEEIQADAPVYILKILRCLLMSRVVSRRPSTAASAVSAGASASASGSPNAVVANAAVSAIWASDAHGSDDASDLYASDAAARTGVNIWPALQSDVIFLEENHENADIFASLLWPDGFPNSLAASWRDLAQHLRDANQDFDFWIAWYESILDGAPQDWDLLERIALIPDEDWKQGPAHTNAIINGYVAQAAVKATPNSEELVFEPEHGTYGFKTKIDLPPLVLGPLINRVQRAVKRMLGSDSLSNQYLPIREDLDLLSEELDQPDIQAIEVFDLLTFSLARLDKRIADGAIPSLDQDANIANLHDAKVKGANTLMGDPNINAAVMARHRNFAALESAFPAIDDGLIDAIAATCEAREAEQLRNAVKAPSTEYDRATLPQRRYTLVSRVVRIYTDLRSGRLTQVSAGLRKRFSDGDAKVTVLENWIRRGWFLIGWLFIYMFGG